MPADHLDPAALPGQGRVIVAFSGGPDSVCLLHQLAHITLERELIAIHVDHGLDPESAERARLAAEIAAGLGTDCRTVRIEVDTGHGPEAAARKARYRALEALMQPDDALLTAHHADDQTETVLLRLIRGAGPDGLAGIRAARRFGPGWLARPLLDWTRSEIENWLQQHALQSIHDPANDCPRFDRNHLRREVIPTLRERWPGVDAALRRSARLCRGAADFIAGRIDRDLDEAAGVDGSLPLDQLSDNSDYYRGAAIRAWCIRYRVEPPSGRRLDTFLEQLSHAAGDRCPELRWDDAVLRYWGRRLWLQRGEDPATAWRLSWDGAEPLELPAGLGVLKIVGPKGPPLKLEVRSGETGESLQPAGDAHHRDCKRLLAEAGVPPWQRHLWPRLWVDERLVALGARWRTIGFDRVLDQRNRRLVWQSGTRRMAGAGLESDP